MVSRHLMSNYSYNGDWVRVVHCERVRGVVPAGTYSGGKEGDVSSLLLALHIFITYEALNDWPQQETVSFVIPRPMFSQAKPRGTLRMEQTAKIYLLYVGWYTHKLLPLSWPDWRLTCHVFLILYPGFAWSSRRKWWPWASRRTGNIYISYSNHL